MAAVPLNLGALGILGFAGLISIAVTDSTQQELDAIQAKVASGEFKLDYDGLAQLYSAYYNCYMDVQEAMRSLHSAYPQDQCVYNPGAPIRGISMMEEQVGKASAGLYAKLGNLSNELVTLMNGLNKSVETMSATDAAGGSSIGRAGG